MTRARPQVVVVGGSFAGLTAAIRLPRRHAVTLVDPSPDFEWIPGVHELLSGVKAPQTLQLDRAAIVARAGHDFVCDRVTALEPAARRVLTARGRELRFDACIVAIGATLNDHRVPGVARQAMPLRSIADAQAITQRLDGLLAAPGSGPVRVVIVGGGVLGVEALGELLRRHRAAPRLSMDLVEAAPRLLSALPEALEDDLRRVCEPFAVRFHTGTAIDAVTPTAVHLADGRELPSSLTIWAAGLSPPPLLAAARLARPPAVWAPVTPTLQSRHFKRVFVAGDAAVLPAPVGKQAYHAIDMGRAAADNADRLLRERPLQPFRPAPRPVMVAFGDLQTYLVAGQAVFASQTFAAAKEGIYQRFMAQMAPGGALAVLPEAGTRLWQSWQKLAWPQLLSLAEARRLPDLRVVRRR